MVFDKSVILVALISKVWTLVHPTNPPSPKVVIEDGKVMEPPIPLQSRKAFCPIVVNVFGKVGKEVIRLQPANPDASIDTRLLGNVSVPVKPEHPLNAEMPILVIWLGSWNVKLVMLVLFKNALVLMAVTAKVCPYVTVDGMEIAVELTPVNDET